MSCAKSDEPIKMPNNIACTVDSGGPSETCIRWSPAPEEGTVLKGASLATWHLVKSSAFLTAGVRTTEQAFSYIV